MDQPLWQILFNIALIGFAARHAAVGLALHLDRNPPALWGVYVALCAACAFAGVAVLFSRRWVMAGLCTVLVALTVVTCTELAIGGVAPAGWLLAQWLMAAAGTALLLSWTRPKRPDDPAAPH